MPIDALGYSRAAPPARRVMSVPMFRGLSAAAGSVQGPDVLSGVFARFDVRRDRTWRRRHQHRTRLR